MASQPPPAPPVAMPPAAPPPAKKTSPWVWVALGCGGLLLLTLLIFLVGGYFVAKKVGDFAKDAEKNPAMAAAKMIAAVNPEIEVVDSDDNRGTITLRNTKTGEVITVDVNDVKEGRIKFTTDKGEAEIRGDGRGLTITTDQGAARFGAADGSYPSWLPEYPGVAPSGTFSSRTGEDSTSAWRFETSDAPEEVLRYFENGLRDNGFEVSTSTTWQDSGKSAGMIVAEQEARGRTVTVTAVAGDEQTEVTVAVREMSR